MLFDVGIQVLIGLDCIKLPFFFIYVDDIVSRVLGFQFQQLTQHVTLAYTSLANDDHNGLFTQILLYLIDIGLANDCLHNFILYKRNFCANIAKFLLCKKFFNIFPILSLIE